MSSFRPSNSAKLYASPEDMKSVGYRSLSLPGHSNRGQLRKSHSLRTPNGGPPTVTFKQNPVSSIQLSNGGPNNQTINGAIITNGGNNQYAQPLKNVRSNSVTGIMRDRKKKTSIASSSSASNLSGMAGG